MMISRRKLLKTSSIGLVGAVAGCSSDDGTSTDESGSPGPGTTQEQEGTDTQEPAYLTGVSTNGIAASVSIRDSETVASVNAIDGDGELYGSKSVNTGVSQVSFQMLRGAPVPEPLVAPGTEFTFVAIDDSGEELGSVEWAYDPQLELARVATGATEFPDYEKSGQWLVFVVENTGTGPAIFDGGSLSHLEDRDVNRMDEAIIGTSGSFAEHPIWKDDIPLAWNYVHPPSRLGGEMSTLYESATDHVVSGGETKMFVLDGFFKADFTPKNLDQEPDYERTYSFTPRTIPEQNSQPEYEFTVELSGEFKSSGQSIQKDVWTTDPEVISMSATEAATDG